jgi:hypothetical protein
MFSSLKWASEVGIQKLKPDRFAVELDNNTEVFKMCQTFWPEHGEGAVGVVFSIIN